MQNRYRSLTFKVLFLAIGFIAGFLVHSYLSSSGSKPSNVSKQDKRSRSKSRRPEGFWFSRNRQKTVPSASEEQLEELAALGYVDGTQKASEKTGVIHHFPERTQPGLNCYTSGHAPEAFLMDSTGKVLHKWKFRFEQAFPSRSGLGKKALGSKYWRRIHLFPNGDLLAIYEGLGLIKIDKNSKLLWAYNGNAHHDLEVSRDGTIYVLTRSARVLENMNSGNPILEDFITILDANGKETRKISILKALQNSPYAAALDPKNILANGDLFHTNTLEQIDGRHATQYPIFKHGNFLLSLCFLDMVAVLDPQQEKLVWALSKMWGKQHQPTILQSGRILVFDNSGKWGRSRVVELDPLTQQLHWEYEKEGFFSEILGSSQRLANGNTLITDSDDGYAFEVAPDRTIVWEFWNPHRAGTNQDLVAVIPELLRLPADYPTLWLQ